MTEYMMSNQHVPLDGLGKQSNETEASEGNWSEPKLNISRLYTKWLAGW